MKEMLRAIIVQGGKEVTFQKSAQTVCELREKLAEHGLTLKDVKRVETFKQSEEKVRGRVARKY